MRTIRVHTRCGGSRQWRETPESASSFPPACMIPDFLTNDEPLAELLVMRLCNWEGKDGEKTSQVVDITRIKLKELAK